MKKAMKAIILALIIAVMPLSAYASTMSTTFFNNTKLGYRRVGTGSLSGQSFSAELTVTVLPGTPAQLDEAYSSEIGVLLHNTSGVLFASHWYSGNLRCFGAATADRSIGHTYTTFEFEGDDLGGYTLYN